MLRIALIATPLGGPSVQVHPIGCMAIGSFLLEELGSDIDCKIFNYTHDKELTLREVAVFWPDIVGFPVYSGHVSEVIELASQVKSRMPDATLIAGGPHVTLTWLSFITRWGHIFDYFVNGDGELPMLAITKAKIASDWSLCHEVSGIGRKTTLGIFETGPAVSLPVNKWVNPFRCEVLSNCERLHFSDRRDRKRRSAVALVSSRSCPQKCSFCAIIAMPGKWRAAPVSELVEWLRLEWHQHKFEHVYFMDANFFVSSKRVREIAEQISSVLPGVTWSTSSTVGYFLRMAKDLPCLIEHGLRGIELGLEAGSDEELRFLNKQATVEQNLQAVALIQQNRLELGLDFIMFYPDQSLPALVENLNFIRKACLLDEEYSDHYFTSLVLYPGTPLRSLYEMRLGINFTPDEIPDIRTMFVDPHVREIYRIFAIEYARKYRNRNEAIVKHWRAEAEQMQATRPIYAQQLRLDAIRLHHLPYRLLCYLAHTSLKRLEGASIDDYWPWLEDFHADDRNLSDLIYTSDSIPEYSLGT